MHYQNDDYSDWSAMSESKILKGVMVTKVEIPTPVVLKPIKGGRVQYSCPRCGVKRNHVCRGHLPEF